MTSRLAIVDWGIGGVGIFRALRLRTASVPVLYLSDSGFTPYGLLGREALACRLARIVRHLSQSGASSVVVACNAASTVIDAAIVRESCGIPVTGVIAPAVAQVPAQFRGVLGVLGGARTIRSGIYRRALAGEGRRIVQRVAQPLSGHVEAGTTSSPRCAVDLDRILAPLVRAKAVLLACTHYPALAASIRARVPEATLIDPADAVVEEALASLPLPQRRAEDVIVTTGDPTRTRRAAQQAWGVDLGPGARVEIA